jgi:hypothetical protein
MQREVCCKAVAAHLGAGLMGEASYAERELKQPKAML